MNYKEHADKIHKEIEDWEKRKELVRRLENEHIDIFVNGKKDIKEEKKSMTWLIKILSLLKNPAISLAFTGACWVRDHLIKKMSPHLLEYFAVMVVPKRTLGIDVEDLIEETAKTQTKWDDMAAKFIAGGTESLKKRQIELGIK